MSPRNPAKGGGAKTPDPVSSGAFRAEILGVTIGYFHEASGLSVEYEVFEYQEGGLNEFVHKLRGRAKYPNLKLSRGLTHEKALLEWFHACQTKADRKELKLALTGPDAQVVREWSFAAAWPVKWEGPSLTADSSNAATESLEIAHEGFLDV